MQLAPEFSKVPANCKSAALTNTTRALCLRCNAAGQNRQLCLDTPAWEFRGAGESLCHCTFPPQHAAHMLGAGSLSPCKQPLQTAFKFDSPNQFGSLQGLTPCDCRLWLRNPPTDTISCTWVARPVVRGAKVVKEIMYKLGANAGNPFEVALGEWQAGHELALRTAHNSPEPVQNLRCTCMHGLWEGFLPHRTDSLCRPLSTGPNTCFVPGTQPQLKHV